MRHFRSRVLGNKKGPLQAPLLCWLNVLPCDYVPVPITVVYRHPHIIRMIVSCPVSKSVNTVLSYPYINNSVIWWRLIIGKYPFCVAGTEPLFIPFVKFFQSCHMCYHSGLHCTLSTRIFTSARQNTPKSGS